MVRLQVLWLIVLSALSYAQSRPKIEGPFQAKDGETCIVCNSKLDSTDLAFVVDGQRVGIARGMEDEFLSNPLKYLTALRPEGQFSGRSTGSMRNVYFWGGVFVLAGLLFGGACAHMALAKGRSGWRWFFLGFFFSAPACLALAVKENGPAVPTGLSKIPATRDPVACPGCGAANHPAAAKCSDCGATLEPSAPSEVSASRQ